MSERTEIIRARIMLGWNQQDLAAAAGLSQRRISSIERDSVGQAQGTSRERLRIDLRKIADALLHAAKRNKFKVDWTAESLTGQS